MTDKEKPMYFVEVGKFHTRLYENLPGKHPYVKSIAEFFDIGTAEEFAVMANYLETHPIECQECGKKLMFKNSVHTCSGEKKQREEAKDNLLKDAIRVLKYIEDLAYTAHLEHREQDIIMDILARAKGMGV